LVKESPVASWEDFLGVLDAPLESLIVPAVQVHFGAIVDRWDLPPDDRAALRRWGLPKSHLNLPEPQDQAEPTLVPNIAGPAERALLAPDQRLYRLGWWGTDDRSPTIGAVAGDGRVLVLLPAPLTVADLNRALRPYYPDFHEPAVTFVNSSVARYVEVAWRWYAANAIYQRMDSPPRHEALANLQIEIEQRRRLLAGLAAIDPAIGDEALDSAWVDAVTAP
jgi:hypothetical protein